MSSINNNNLEKNENSVHLNKDNIKSLKNIGSNDLVVFSGRAGKHFAEKVVEHFLSREDCPVPSLKLGEISIFDFQNGEPTVRLRTNVRKKEVHVFQSITLGARKNLTLDFFEVFLINDALKRAGAKSIINYWSFLPFQRQDRKTSGREPISARLIFDLLATSGGKYFNTGCHC